jgi:hypothetical protein
LDSFGIHYSPTADMGRTVVSLEAARLAQILTLLGVYQRMKLFLRCVKKPTIFHRGGLFMLERKQ